MISEFQLEQLVRRIDSLEEKIKYMNLDIQNIKTALKSVLNGVLPKESIEGMIKKYFKEG